MSPPQEAVVGQEERSQAGVQPATPEGGPPADDGSARSRPARKKLSDWEEFMEFVNVLRDYFGSWGEWLRMVAKEGIKRDIAERKKNSAIRRRHQHDARMARGRWRAQQQQGGTVPQQQQAAAAQEAASPDTGRGARGAV